MTGHDAGSDLDFTDNHRWSADGWCFTHSTEAGPVYCRQPTVWETCSGCGKDYAYPHLCREHQLCGLCHPDLPKDD